MADFQPKVPRLIYPRQQRMSDGALLLHRHRCWLEVCYTDRRYDSQAIETEYRLREQASFLIGFMAGDCK